MTTRDWLLADSPTSLLQARLGASYRAGVALLGNPLAAIGLVIVLLLIVMAVFAPWLAPYSPFGQSLGERLQPPSMEHWMGTDELGRDLEAEPRVVARVAEHDDGTGADSPGGLQAGSDQGGADPPPLQVGPDGHRGEAEQERGGSD